MAQAIFQAKLSLQNISPLDGDMLEWSCDVGFTDADGAFTGYDVHINDVLAVDTGGMEPGSFTLYTITQIGLQDFSSLTVTVRYSSSNDNLYGPPDLSSFVGNDCMITRPSANLQLLPVVSRDQQGMSDKFTEYVQNYNFVKIVDTLSAGEPTFPKTNGDPFILSRGMVVYIDDTNDTLAHAADAAAYSSSRATGLVTSAATLAASVCSIQSHGLFEHTTIAWDALTGSTGGLKAGRDYFLRAGAVGGISLVPPTANGACIVKIGKAISTTVLDIDIEPPIQL